MRLKFYVEGYTEAAFVSEVLAPHLYTLGTYEVTPCLVWNASDRRRISKGGGKKWSAARRGLHDLLRDSSHDVRFTTMFDLYDLFDDFPGMPEAIQQRDRSKRVQILEKALAEDLG